MKKIIFILFSFLALLNLEGYCYQKNDDLKSYGLNISYLKDENHNFSVNQALKLPFTKYESDIFNFGVDQSTYWIKLTAKRAIKKQNLVLWIDQSRLLESYLLIKSKNSQINTIPTFNPFSSSKPDYTQGKIYKLPNPINIDDIILLKLRSKEVFLAPVSIVDERTLIESFSVRGIVFGFYSGIMSIMFVYNLFLYIIIRDRSYLFYIFYIFFTWSTQVSIQGYSSKYFWDQFSFIDDYSIILFSNLALLFASLFTISFLNTKAFSKTAHNLITLLCWLTIINIVILFAFGKNISFLIMQILTVSGTILALSAANFVYFKKHFKPAGYYLVAWSILLLGAILFILKDYDIIPYNNFTIYLLQIASAVEVTLLSFALADKINFFKKENEVAQVQALNASLENQKLIREQNIVLEQKVKERTEELETTNSTLNITLTNLKDTQSQLVDSEKMAALGQLTAGIAHEINNPINFVTSNIKPLELDINDLKEIISRYEEIDFDGDVKAQIEEIEGFKKQIDLGFVNNEISSLLSGISEGAKRTAEIIRSLRNFSRVDETDMKPIDLNEGLHSTLVLVKNSMPDNLTVIKDLGNLPKVECQPGKINQVFMNLVSNAIQAIKTKSDQREEEFLTIKSWYIDQQVKISIKDTGTGMSEETKHRIFEPFFTTKDIGEGTGLGLSIVFSIIEKHKGHIEVNSKIGDGTEFIITLNVNPN
ncbi:sensor histidine kinase [Pedobacter cryotolerans]|uniref:histidine kinase n=1 Tax=Pedobacter cryotolerans TaxID=2571270 RepID=A0A4U1C7D3_9SPHI|nr:7TM diverse intracellular signaling domain-containing protein [Pedobacter cryotolerans]TKC01354.1 GHKL domain-containing protein [Pedobacter cryotolerans]